MTSFLKVKSKYTVFLNVRQEGKCLFFKIWTKKWDLISGPIPAVKTILKTILTLKSEESLKT
jgi:hypothetical protein